MAEGIKVKAEKCDGNDTGFLIIEKENFDESIHELYDEAAKSDENPAASDEPKEGSKPWLKLQLEKAEVEFDSGASKAELQELVDGLTDPE